MPRHLNKIDDVCLWINTANLDEAIALARDLRACTRSLLIGPTFFLANGIHGVRCFYELGISSVILDLRLIGTPYEIWHSVIAAAKHGVIGISLSTMVGCAGIKCALDAADASRLTTHKIRRPYIIVSALPATLDAAALIDELQLRVRRPKHITQMTKNVVEAGADGICVEYTDLKAVKAVTKELPTFVYAKRRAHSYTEYTPKKAQQIGISEIRSAGGSHVVMDSRLLHHTDAEWAADMVNKELEAGKSRG